MCRRCRSYPFQIHRLVPYNLYDRYKLLELLSAIPPMCVFTCVFGLRWKVIRFARNFLSFVPGLSNASHMNVPFLCHHSRCTLIWNGKGANYRPYYWIDAASDLNIINKLQNVYLEETLRFLDGILTQLRGLSLSIFVVPFWDFYRSSIYCYRSTATHS